MSAPDITQRFARNTTDDVIQGLTPAELRGCLALARWDTDGDGIVCPGLRALGRYMKLSPSTVDDLLDVLVRLGVIERLGVHPRYRSMRYRLLWLSTDRAGPLTIDRAGLPRDPRGWSARSRAGLPRERRPEDVEEGADDHGFAAVGLAGIAAARAAMTASAPRKALEAHDLTRQRAARRFAGYQGADPPAIVDPGATEPQAG